MSTYKKYTDDEISNIISKYGFTLVEYNNVCDISAKDCDGYMYKLRLSNLRFNKKPNKFMCGKFAIYNIKRYLQLNYPQYELLDNEYHGVKHKMRFICNNHKNVGVQLNSIDNIVNNKHCCKYCSYEKMREERVINEEELIKLCKNRNVVYIGRYTLNHESIIKYMCKKHTNVIQEMALTHFKESKSPCRYCGTTNGESVIINYLIKQNLSFVKEKTFDGLVSDNNKKLRFDFYLTDYNVLIEYDGRQHFEPVVFWYGQDAESNLNKNKYHDMLKNNYCATHNIKLIRIPYTQFNNIEQILTSELSDVIF